MPAAGEEAAAPAVHTAAGIACPASVAISGAGNSSLHRSADPRSGPGTNTVCGGLYAVGEIFNSKQEYHGRNGGQSGVHALEGGMLMGIVRYVQDGFARVFVCRIP